MNLTVPPNLPQDVDDRQTMEGREVKPSQVQSFETPDVSVRGRSQSLSANEPLAKRQACFARHTITDDRYTYIHLSVVASMLRRRRFHLAAALARCDSPGCEFRTMCSEGEYPRSCLGRSGRKYAWELSMLRGKAEIGWLSVGSLRAAA